MRDEAHLLPNGKIMRYTFHERLMHWLAALSYVYLLLTGLAFWTPWLFWIAVALGGATISRELHPWAGLIFVAATIWMYRTWSGQMHETEVDKEWWRALPHYVKNEDDQVPKIDRFNAGQKFLFWGFFWSALVLLLSGLVLWFPQELPWSWRFLRYIAVIVHPVTALITIALFMIHLYMGLAVEGGALHSIVRGDVTQAWARAFHRLWYEKVMRQSTQSTASK
jgi:formate dehydrogenase subunit gamma